MRLRSGPTRVHRMVGEPESSAEARSLISEPFSRIATSRSDTTRSVEHTARRARLLGIALLTMLSAAVAGLSMGELGGESRRTTEAHPNRRPLEPPISGGSAESRVPAVPRLTRGAQRRVASISSAHATVGSGTRIGRVEGPCCRRSAEASTPLPNVDGDIAWRGQRSSRTPEFSFER